LNLSEFAGADGSLGLRFGVPQIQLRRQGKQVVIYVEEVKAAASIPIGHPAHSLRSNYFLID